MHHHSMRAAPVCLSASLQTSKEPKRRKVGAMRSTVAQRSAMAFPVYSGSLTTRLSEVTQQPARVVAMPCMRKVQQSVSAQPVCMTLHS